MLTLVIPTKNRSAFLSRLLNYCASVRCKHRILIGDSSNDTEHAKILSHLNLLKGQIHVDCIRLMHDEGMLPGQGIIVCTKTLLENVQTPYAAWLPDDDFLILSTLDKCTAFLEAHPDYSAVHGKAILFQTISDGAYGKIGVTSAYPQNAIENDTASDRFLNNLTRYSPTEFSVKRTDSIRRQWQMLFEAKLDNLLGEIFISCLTVIEGKVKMLCDLYMVRQGHAGMTSVSSQNSFDLIISADFNRQFECFCGILMNALGAQGVSSEEAGELVKKGYCYNLAKALSKKCQWACPQGRRGEGKTKVRRFLAQQVPSLASCWRQIYSFSPKGKMTLPALLRSSSPYYNDFIPIYQTITQLNEIDSKQI